MSVQHINLSPGDVPGAEFIENNIEDHSVLQLRRRLHVITNVYVI